MAGPVILSKVSVCSLPKVQTFFVLDNFEFYGHHVYYLSPMEIDHQELTLNFPNVVAELVDSAKSGL